MQKIIVSIVILFLVSGCASIAEWERDEEGRISKVKCSGNQKFKIDIKNEVIEVDTKTDYKLVDEVTMMKAGT